MKYLKLLLITGLISIGFQGLLPAGQTEYFKVIINSSVQYSRLTTKDISNIFLKKMTRWPENGMIIHPVDQIDDSVVRINFSNIIHGRKVEAVKAYWQQQIFSGREIPPLEKNSDEEVIKYIEKKKYSIGYVSKSVDLTQYNVIAIEIAPK